MTRRRVLLLGSVAVVAALAVAVWVWPRPSAITVENAERIQNGMTRAEVEAILGGPARWEASSDAVTTARHGHARPSEPPDHQWVSDYAVVWVFFDDDGLVLGTMSRAVFPTDESLLDRFRRWLRL
jgi:hypothetical protein